VDQVPGLTGHVHVHDILSDNSLSSPLMFKADGNSGIQFLKNTLLNYPTGARSRVILVDLDFYKTIDQQVFNLLRVSFNIEPVMF